MMENKNKRSDFSYRYLVDRLAAGETLQREEWRALLEDTDAGHEAYLQKVAETVTARNFGKGVYVRGLIEISSYCRNDCFYCGLRRSNRQALRYRLSADEILACCEEGARLGFATFVLQGGEDGGQGDEWLAAVVGSIKQRFPSCAVTLSVGERPEAAYRLFREAGADRYLLRHETANALHYALLHPKEMSLERRLDCLRVLKALGFQTGAGMMIGSPGQTADCLLDDIALLEAIRPEMIGMGPFLPAAHTPFAGKEAGSAAMTLKLIALMRLRFPRALIPATTALATLSPTGREDAIRCGANVIMPNLSPLAVRSKYSIYDHKACTGCESAQALKLTEDMLARIGYHIVYGRGDYEKERMNELDIECKNKI